MLEGDHQGRLVKWLKAVGTVVLNVHGHEMQEPGWPDLQIYHWRWTGHLEVKRNKYGLEPLQRKRMRDLHERGTKAFVIRFYDATPHTFQLEYVDETPVGDAWDLSGCSKQEAGKAVITALTQLVGYGQNGSKTGSG